MKFPHAHINPSSCESSRRNKVENDWNKKMARKGDPLDELGGSLRTYPCFLPLQLGCADQCPNLPHSTSFGPSKAYVSWQPYVALSL